MSRYYYYCCISLGFYLPLLLLHMFPAVMNFSATFTPSLCVIYLLLLFVLTRGIFYRWVGTSEVPYLRVVCVAAASHFSPRRVSNVYKVPVLNTFVYLSHTFSWSTRGFVMLPSLIVHVDTMRSYRVRRVVSCGVCKQRCLCRRSPSIWTSLLLSLFG